MALGREFLHVVGVLERRSRIVGLGISEPSEIDVEIAQYLGATVAYQPLTGCDARIPGNTEAAIITVDSTSNRGRQRFSRAGSNQP